MPEQSLATILTVIAVVVGAVVLDVNLIRWIRAVWPVDESAPQVRVLGIYSPVLTWLKYRRLAAPKPRQPTPALETETRPGDLLASGGVWPASQSPVEIASSVTSALPRASEEFIPAPQAVSAAESEVNQFVSSGPAATPVDLEARWSLALALSALALALIGQVFYSFVRQDVQDGLIFSVVAGLVFWIALERSYAGAEGSGSTIRQAHRWLKGVVEAHPFRTVLFGASLALTYINWRLLQNKPITASHVDTFLIWLLALSGYLVAFAPVRWRFPSVTHRDWAALAGLVALAFSLRIVLLDSLPADWYMDELSHAFVATRVLDGSITDMFITWQSDGTLPSFAMAIPLRVLGLSRFSMRLLPALAGTLTVALVFLSGRRMFDFQTALLASLVLATSHFHLHFSRSALGYNVYDAVFATGVLGLLYHGLERRSRFVLALSGVGMGLTMYGFVAGRVISLIAAGYLGLLWLKNLAAWRAYVVPGLIVAAGALVTAAPMLLWARQSPGEFWYSIKNESVLVKLDWLKNEAQFLKTTEWAVLLNMLKQALLAFNYYPADLFYGATLPALDLIGSALGMLGLVVMLRSVREPRFLLLLVWIALPVVLGGALVLTPHGSAYRILMVFPALCLLIGLGLSRLLQTLGAARRWGYALVAGLMLVSVGINLKAYFVDFGPKSFTTLAQDANALAGIRAHAYAGQLGSQYRVYFLGLPRLSTKTYYTLDILNPGVEMVDRPEPLGEDFSFVDETKGKAFIVLPERNAELGILEQRYPGGQIESSRAADTLLFTIYRVP